MFRVQCAVAVCLALTLATVAEAQTIGTSGGNSNRIATSSP